MLKVRKYLLFFVGAFFVGCFVPKKTIKDFTFCFDNEDSELNFLIKTNGFYLSNNDSIGHDYMFYDNGFTNVGSGNFWSNTSSKNDKYGFYGKYNVNKDTLKVQYITSPQGQTTGKIDVWFKIIDKTTLEMIYYGAKQYIKKTDLEEFKLNHFYVKNKATIFKFFPLDERPDINKTYIINKKWFWCNENLYKNWKSNH